jgi:ABC-2 type transport system ATP-binding protein
LIYVSKIPTIALVGTETFLKASRITKFYGPVRALNDVSFEISKHAVVGLLGPNGAGKTTLLRILSGLLTPSSGALYVEGRSVAIDGDQWRRQIAYLPESNPLPDHCRVREYLMFRAKLKGIPGQHRAASVEEAMGKCDLNRTAAHKIIGRLSKGFRQRVGIADMLIGQPSMAIFDEPTIGLDPHQMDDVRRLLEELKTHTTLIFSSHILAEVEASCSHLIILDHGEVVAAGTPEDLKKNLGTPTRYEVRLRCSPDKLTFLLENFAHQTGHFLSIKTSTHCGESFFDYGLEVNDPDFPSERLVRFLIENQMDVHRFSPSQTTLEQLFMSLTQRIWKPPSV